MQMSVVMKLNIVHMLGWIMPEPLHMPPMVTVVPSSSNCTATSFFVVSVVMMAVAADAPSSRVPPSFGAIISMPPVILSMGS